MKCPHCHAELHISISAVPRVGPKEASEKQSAPENGHHLTLAELLDGIRDDQVEENAAVFVRETRERFSKFGDRTKMSPKQMGWLRRIHREQNPKGAAVRDEEMPF